MHLWLPHSKAPAPVLSEALVDSKRNMSRLMRGKTTSINPLLSYYAEDKVLCHLEFDIKTRIKVKQRQYIITSLFPGISCLWMMPCKLWGTLPGRETTTRDAHELILRERTILYRVSRHTPYKPETDCICTEIADPIESVEILIRLIDVLTIEVISQDRGDCCENNISMLVIATYDEPQAAVVVDAPANADEFISLALNQKALLEMNRVEDFLPVDVQLQFVKAAGGDVSAGDGDGTLAAGVGDRDVGAGGGVADSRTGIHSQRMEHHGNSSLHSVGEEEEYKEGDIELARFQRAVPSSSSGAAEQGAFSPARQEYGDETSSGYFEQKEGPELADQVNRADEEKRLLRH